MFPYPRADNLTDHFRRDVEAVGNRICRGKDPETTDYLLFVAATLYVRYVDEMPIIRDEDETVESVETQT